MEANLYTFEIDASIASRFLLMAGVGLPARRPTCLIELQEHVIRTFGAGAPERTEQINKTLYHLAWDLYRWSDAVNRPIRRFAGV